MGLIYLNFTFTSSLILNTRSDPRLKLANAFWRRLLWEGVETLRSLGANIITQLERTFWCVALQGKLCLRAWNIELWQNRRQRPGCYTYCYRSALSTRYGDTWTAVLPSGDPGMNSWPRWAGTRQSAVHCTASFARSVVLLVIDRTS